MKRVLLLVLMGSLLVAERAFAQQRTITGRVTSEQGSPLAGVAVVVKGTSIATSTNNDGEYSIQAEVGQVLQFRFIGTALVERTVGPDGAIDVALRRVALSLEAVEVTALGQTAARRTLGTSQQAVQGTEIAQTQRENFLNALQGRVAGLDVTSTSGVPGASTSITIRGVSSISGSNQPLLIVDGLPLDNKTTNTELLASDRSSNTAMSNRGVDFTNRAADLNPEDIESVTVLKGPEASALYGIDAANGAIVITTKRGRTGASSVEYSNSFAMVRTGARPEIQNVYGPTTVTGGQLGSFTYFGSPYPAGTTFYDNIDGFFRTAVTAHNNLVFSGVTSDSRINYRIGASAVQQNGVVPNSSYDRYNLTASSRAQVKDWLTADLSMTYAYDTNDQPWKGDNGPLLGLLSWPQTDNAKDYLTPAGTRRRLTLLTAGGEIDNPYFNVARNRQNSRNNRIIANLGLTVAPFSWGYLQTNLGVDGYTLEQQIVRDPQSALGVGSGGILDNETDVTRNLSAQTLLNFNDHRLASGLSIGGLVGNGVIDQKQSVDAADGTLFLDPNFVSINNTTTRLPLTTDKRRRVVSLFGKATLNFRDYLYLTVTGRNDWSSTLPPEHRSFFYPGVSTSFILSDAVRGVGRFMTAKLRAAYAEAGKDAPPYAFRPALQYKTTSFGGYGYDFWGPNLNLRPEFARSVEGGVELGFLNDRLGLDVTAYRKVTTDMIVQNIRGSYGTGFILFNVNGGKTRSRGVEATLRGTPIQQPKFSWDFSANFAASGSIVLSLPRDLPESYVSDTWLYGNVRAGVKPGLSTMALTGTFYLRNNRGQLLIDPTSGLPIRSPDFIDGGYDRQPDFTLGLGNTFRYKRWTLDFLLDFRKGGDVFNATQHYLTTHGLSPRTLDRQQPRVIPGVLRDGKENSANPTTNTIVVIPAVQTAYYTNMSEELFIERDINWMRLRDVQVSYALPSAALRFLHARDASVYLRGTDLFLITNYSGLDPIVNGNTAAVGGSGGVGIDYGNFPVPRGLNFGVKVGF